MNKFRVFYTDGYNELIHAEDRKAAILKATTPRMGYSPTMQFIETEEEYLAKTM